MKPHTLIDLQNPDLEWEYMGFGLNRKFHPCLKITRNNMTFIFEGYDTLWNLLDTVCWRQPLPRSHFNDVLKHRFPSENTALEILQDVLRGGDATKIIVQGDEEGALFIVRIIHDPWGGLKSPILNEISDIMLTDDAIPHADAMFWEPYQAHLKGKPGFALSVISLPSIVGLWEIGKGFMVIRCLYVKKTETFLFIPTLEVGDTVYGHPSEIVGCPSSADYKTIHEILKKLHFQSKAAISLINEKTPAFSNPHGHSEGTVPKYKRNARIMRQYLGLSA